MKTWIKRAVGLYLCIIAIMAGAETWMFVSKVLHTGKQVAAYKLACMRVSP